MIFAFHGYPSLIHQLAYRRTNHANLHVRGFIEKGTTTTPFDMLHLNDLDRYRLALDVLHRVRGLASRPGVAEIADEWHAARAAARDSRIRARRGPGVDHRMAVRRRLTPRIRQAVPGYQRPCTCARISRS